MERSAILLSVYLTSGLCLVSGFWIAALPMAAATFLIMMNHARPDAHPAED